MTIETSAVITVQSDPDYRYEVQADEPIVRYIDKYSDATYISFGSVEEMEAVAKAMLQSVEMHRKYGT